MTKTEAKRIAQSRLVTRSFRFKLGLTLLIALLLMCLAGWKFKGTASLVFWITAGIMFVIVMILGRRRFTSEQRSSVLWIRRFHRGTPSRNEQVFLEQVVLPWGRLISIGDASVDASATVRSSQYLLFGLVLGLIVSAVCKVIGMDIPESILNGISGGLLPIILFAKHGQISLREKDWQKTLDAALRDRSQYRSAGVVFNCPRDTELWRDVVRSLSTRVDAVILSVPERPPAVDWEVHTFRETLGPDKMIIFDSYASEYASVLKGVTKLSMPDIKVSFWLPTSIRNHRIWKAATLVVGTAIGFRSGQT